MSICIYVYQTYEGGCFALQQFKLMIYNRLYFLKGFDFSMARSLNGLSCTMIDQ